MLVIVLEAFADSLALSDGNSAFWTSWSGKVKLLITFSFLSLSATIKAPDVF